MTDKTKLSRKVKSTWAMGSIADVYMTNALNLLELQAELAERENSDED